MRAALVAEYRKLISTRMWWILLVVMVCYLALMGGVLAASMTLVPDQPDAGTLTLKGQDAAMSVYSVTNFVGYVFPLVIGSLAVTTEFRHRTITASLLASPSRTQLILAKLISSIPIGVFYGVFGTLALVATAATTLQIFGDGAFLNSSEVLKVVAFSALALVIWTVIGVSFGLVVTNQVAAIIIIIAFTQLVEPVLRMVALNIDALATVGKYLPGAAADAVVGSSYLSVMAGGASTTLSRPAGVLVLLAYAAVFALIGRLTTFKGDIA